MTGTRAGENIAIIDLVEELRSQQSEAWAPRLAEALLVHGVWLLGSLGTLAGSDPFAELVLERAWSRAVGWLRGERLSDRADEDELRAALARRILEGGGAAPVVELSCAMALLALPAGHPWRNDGALRALIWRDVRVARQVGDSATELDALALLVRRRLGTHRSVLAAIRRGDQLATDNEMPQKTRAYLISSAGYFASLLAGGGTCRSERRWARHAVEHARTAEQLSAGQPDQQSDDMLVLAFVYDSTGDMASAASCYEQAIEGVSLDDDGHQQAALRAGVLRSLLSQPREAVRVLERVVPVFEESYLMAVHDHDVSFEGANFSVASVFLAFAYAATGDWSASFQRLDRVKSLRSRYRSALLEMPAGRDAVALERKLRSLARGADAVFEREATHAEQDIGDRARLLEQYRQTRSVFGASKIRSPEVSEVAAILDETEAVLAVGVGPLGTLVFVVCHDDTAEPLGHFFLADWTDRRWNDLLVGADDDGWIYAIADPDRGLDPRLRLDELLYEIDGQIGSPVAKLLADRGVSRITVVPHLWFHLCPFWALPSWAGFEVRSEPHAAGLLGRSADQWNPKTCLTVANPTLDLPIADAESQAVACRFERAGWRVTRLSHEEATVTKLAEELPSADLFHFAGHAISDVSQPENSALLLYDRVVTQSAVDRVDPFGELAALADWRSTGDGERIAKIRSAGVLHEVAFDGVAERRLESASGRTLWARYDRWGVRGAELWTAEDIAITRSVGDCQLAILSACQAAQGGLGPLDESAGLPFALRSVGVRGVISPLWPVYEDVAAVFVDVLADELVGAEPEPDFLHLVHRARLALKTMSSTEVCDRLALLRLATTDPIARASLSAAIFKRAEGPHMPFAHPYDWAAFTLTGAPGGLRTGGARS